MTSLRNFCFKKFKLHLERETVQLGISPCFLRTLFGWVRVGLVFCFTTFPGNPGLLKKMRGWIPLRFKIFVVNPQKPLRIQQILVKNKVGLGGKGPPKVGKKLGWKLWRGLFVMSMSEVSI